MIFGGRQELNSGLLAALVTKCFYYKGLASFPGPAQLSVLKVPESWVGPGNEANESL